MTFLGLTAGDLMTTAIVTIGRGETLRVAASLMSKSHIHCLVVAPEDPRGGVGIVTLKDIVQVLCEGDETLVDRLRVQDVMSDPAVCIQRDSLVRDCIRLMRAAGVRSAPVLHATTPVGLLSFTDVVRKLGEP